MLHQCTILLTAITTTVDDCCNDVVVASNHSTATNFIGTYSKDATTATDVYHEIEKGNYLYHSETKKRWVVSITFI